MMSRSGFYYRHARITANVVALTMATLLVPQSAMALQICTTQTFGNDDFLGIDGSNDTNVIAVGKQGSIAIFDGTSWSTPASPTTEELRDVHVISAGVAFAVGKKGEIWQQNGAGWLAHPGVTTEDLNGVWAASASAVWVVGKKGEIHFYDGAVWTDQTLLAGTSNKDMNDAWGNAAEFYGLNDDGVLYRYDRISGTWDPPDTLCTFGNKFEDLWGDGNGNLYLVRKEDVYLHTGSSCSLFASAGEDLLGISGSVASEEIYAVGKKGEVMYYNGAAWQITQEGTRDLNDDWVSDIGNAYYAGKKGEVTVCEKVLPNVVADWLMDDCTLDLPSSPVIDSGPNGLDGVTVGGMSLVTTGQLCQAAGMDGSSGYITVADDPLLDLDEGLGFAVWVRHDATTLTDWESIFAKGDSAYRLHLNGGCGIADTLPGNTRYGITLGFNGGCNDADLNSNFVPVPGVWTHVAGSYDRLQMHIYINGTLANSANHSTAINQNNVALNIGENSGNTGRNWNGDIDELMLWDSTITAKDVRDHMNRTRTCTSCSIVETVVSHDNFGIHCLSESIQVDLVDSLAGTPRTDYNTQITLDTQNGFGDWTLISGSGAFSDAVAGDGLATYDWPLGESTAVFALDYRAGPATLNVDTYETLDPAVRDQDGEGDLLFSASGFTLTGTPLSNPPPTVIAPFSGPRTAGTDMPLYLTAYGQSPSDAQCGVIETYTGPQNVTFWSAYLNPNSGTRLVTIDALQIAANEATASPQALTFTNGQAAVVAKYKDVGLMQIRVKDDSFMHPDLPTGIRGATASFVVKPDSFTLSNIEDGSGNPNPAAAGSAGPVFLPAGQPFTVTVTARDAEGDPTPNYGRETIAESVALTAILVAPVAGVNPPVTAGTGFSAFAGGSATGTDFNWPEVGIITLTPSVGDGDYLSGGNVTGTASGNVGRFIPDHFDVALSSPTFGTACASGGFTYIGETFNYSMAPRITLTARAATASVTQNYTGAFFKLNNTTVQNRSYVAVGHALDTAGLPPPAVDPAINDVGSGVATLTFSGGSGLKFVRTTPEAPFAADIRLSIDVLDADNVSPASNPVVFGAGGGIAFDAGQDMRYGRIHLANSLGSELVNLSVQQTSQVFASPATGFVTHTADNCTIGTPLSLGAWAGSLNAGETCVLDTGTPGSSGAGCGAAGPPAQRYRTPPLGGDFNLFLAAPGAGNDGSVTISSDVPSWLEFDWDAAMPGLEDPTGTATFGIYSGNARRIYQREIY